MQELRLRKIAVASQGSNVDSLPGREVTHEMPQHHRNVRGHCLGSIVASEQGGCEATIAEGSCLSALGRLSPGSRLGVTAPDCGSSDQIRPALPSLTCVAGASSR